MRSARPQRRCATRWPRGDRPPLAETAVSAPVPVWGQAFSASTKASAGFGDIFVFSSSSLAAGVPVSLAFAYGVHAGMGGSSTPGAVDPIYPHNSESHNSWSAHFHSLSALGSQDLFANGACSTVNGSDPPNCVDDFSVSPHAYLMQLTVGNGQSVLISMDAEVRAAVYGGTAGGGNVAASAQTDLEHTIYWGGIRSATDSSGHLLSGYSAISPTSGFDYVQPFAMPVPEPVTMSLLVAGLLAIGATGQRRRRH